MAFTFQNMINAVLKNFCGKFVITQASTKFCRRSFLGNASMLFMSDGSLIAIISAMFIPFQVIMLPLVVQANAFHLDNIYGISFLYIIFGLPMNTFLYTGAIKAIPEALDEAAMIDGANPIQIFSRVIFPVLKPTTATVAILSFMWTWNDFSMPLVLLSDESQQTLQLAQYVFKSQFSVDYNLAFASYLLVLAPVLIVYIFCQKWIMNGVVAGAVK